MYSPEEVQKKRLMAEQRKAQLHQSKPPNSLQSNGNTNGMAVKRKLNSSPLATIQSKQAKLAPTIPPATFFGKNERIKAECRMITESRFEIKVQYYQQLIEFFKSIPSRAYDQKSRLWNFHIDDYGRTVNGMKEQFSGDIDVSGIPQSILQIFQNNLNKINRKKNNNLTKSPNLHQPDLSMIDPVLLSKLMPFQRDGIFFAIENHGRCMIADDMGLGKTIQALGIAHYYKDTWPLLIVTPSSVRHQWSQSIFEFLPSIPCQHVLQYSSGRDYLGDEKITIVSYDMLARNIDKFQQKSFGCVIFDESHMMKNYKTVRTKAAQRIVNTARHILLLTGTPALSRPIELYTQISLIKPNFMHLKDYGIRYCQGKKTTWGWDYKGAANTQELQLLLKSSCLIRRLKSDVLTQLPDKIRQVVRLDPELIVAGTKEMKKMSDNLSGKMLEGFEKHAELMRYYSQSSKQRLKAVGNYVEDLVEKGEKFLIFAHHTCVLDRISEVLDKLRVGYIRIDGKTTADARQNRIKQFQEREECLVAVLSITAANSGITLHAASFVVFAELYWNPAELTQAEDRVHRIGQRNCVIIQYLIAQGTVDDIMWPMLQAKAHFLRTAGLDQRFSLSQADLLQQSPEKSSTSGERKQGTLESFGFSQSTSSSCEEEYATPMETFSSSENGNSSRNDNDACDENTEKTDDFAKMLDDDIEDFDDIDLENIN